MWIAMNDSFVSVVEDQNDKTRVSVRARVKDDLISLFPSYQNNIITTDDSDYRFRLFLDKSFVSEVIAKRILNINYDNFKNSVKQKWRKEAYMQIWSVMFKIQSRFYPSHNQNWWLNYRR